MCGDAFNPEHVDLLMQGEKAGMLYCDPPYGMRLNTDFTSMKPWAGRAPVSFVPGRKGQGKSYAAFAGDERDFDPSALIARFASCKEQFWWGADYYSDRIPDRDRGSWIIWDKRDGGRLDRMFGSSFEMCWSRKRHKRDVVRVMWAGVWGTQWEPERRRIHPTQKPIKLAEWFLERYSKTGSIVVDLFAGSGSTLLACERMGRRARVMEIDSQYCQVIVDRYESLVGKARQLDLGA